MSLIQPCGAKCGDRGRTRLFRAGENFARVFCQSCADERLAQAGWSRAGVYG